MNTRTKSRKKPHAAEIAAEKDMIDAIRSADHFLASLFIGRGEYKKRTARTVAAAERVALELEQSSHFTRRCMLYAVSRDNVATFLTDELLSKLKGMSR